MESCPRESCSVLEGEPEIVGAIHVGDTARVLELLSSPGPEAAKQMANTRLKKGGWTVLHMTALADEAEMMARLLECGADLLAADPNGHTALHYAAAWDSVDCIRCLISHASNEEGRLSALLNATTEDQLCLLNGSIPICLVGGQTALHIASEKGYMDCTKLLLEAGIAADIKDFNGRTAYDLAVNEGRISIASLLRPDITEHKSALPKDQVADRLAIRARLKAKEKLDRKKYREMILHNYSRLHPSLFSFQKSFFQESFLRAIEGGSRESLLAILEEVHPGIFVFPMLSPDYCSLMLEELDNFEQSGLPLKRPNSMNNYGVILNDIGFKEAMYELLERYINPFASLLFAEDGGLSLDRHHSFVVKYKLGEDLDLKEHVDDSDVTLNVCLGKEFEGGELEFNGVLGTKTSKKDKFLLSHRPGFGILHLGKHWHAARPILNGERWNLIVWCRSSTKRDLPVKHK